MKRGLNWWWLALRFTIGGEERETERQRRRRWSVLPQSVPQSLYFFFFSEIGEARGHQWGWAFLSCSHLAGERRRSP